MLLLKTRSENRQAPSSTCGDGGCPRVVIVGAGFGGLSAAKTIGKCGASVTVIDRRNYHLFQPLLYQVATAGLSESDIAAPIRGILRDQANTTVLMGMVRGIDTEHHQVLMDDGKTSYDYLVLATGARHAYSDDDWEAYAPGLKKVEDATNMRAKILMAFERAEVTTDDKERSRLLTFVVVGGGATGVELAGALAKLAKRALARDFRNIDPRQARIVLLQRGPRILPGFSEALSTYARDSLAKLGVEVRTGVNVDHVDQDGAIVSGHRIEARTVIWAAGVMASPAGRWLAAERDARGRVLVEPDLSVPGHPEVFVIGDAASVRNADGRQLPGIAPVANQQGRYVGRLIQASIEGRSPPRPIPLPPLRQHGDDRAFDRRCRLLRPELQRSAGMDPMGHRPRLFPNRIPEQTHGYAQLALALSHIPARHAPDHRRPGVRPFKSSTLFRLRPQFDAADLAGDGFGQGLSVFDFAGVFVGRGQVLDEILDFDR